MNPFNLQKPCDEWQGACNSKGYGHRYISGVYWLVHRLEWVKHKGPVPEGKIVRHLCNNRKCREIEHLSLGTYLDNSADQRLYGSKVGRVGNSPREAKVADILEGKLSSQEIAVKHNTSRGAVNKLRKQLEPR